MSEPYSNDYVWGLQEKIKRLRGDKAALQYGLNASVSAGKEMRYRIEELEAILRRLVERRMGDCFEFVIDDAKAVVGPLESNRHIITTDQIRAAWEVAQYIHRTSNVEWIANIVFKALAKLGIVRCDGCEGDGHYDGSFDPERGLGKCRKCNNGEGWVKCSD